MNRKPQSNSYNIRLDRILAEEDALLPSSGFMASVMERVHEEAAAPPPIPFPWKRAIPGIVFAAGVLGWGGFELIRLCLPALEAVTMSAPHFSAALARPLRQTGWVALALAISLASWIISRGLAGRSGLS